MAEGDKRIVLELTLTEWTTIATALMKDLEKPSDWHFINKNIAEGILHKISNACGGGTPHIRPAE